MGLNDRCSAGTPAGSPGPRSWPPGASSWRSSSCSAGGPRGPLSGTHSRRRWRWLRRRLRALAAGAMLRAPGGGSQLAVPLALADATPGEGQSNEGPGAQLAAPAAPQEPPQEDAGPAAGLPGVQFVPAVRPEQAVPEADRGPEHFIYLARTRRVHKPDPDEANADRAAWRAVGCGWPYGGRQFFRLSAPPPGAAFCRRCFPAGLEGCSEAVESSSGSSSRASGSSPSLTSSDRAWSTSESGGSTSES